MQYVISNVISNFLSQQMKHNRYKDEVYVRVHFIDNQNHTSPDERYINIQEILTSDDEFVIFSKITRAFMNRL